MSITNPEVPHEKLTSHNPNFIQHQQSDYNKTAHSDSKSSKILSLQRFAQVMEDRNDLQSDASSVPSSPNAEADAASLCGLKQKKLRPKRTAEEMKSLEKLRVLAETLKPVPFTPSESLDFRSHESLLRKLGLWDFVHIEFDRTIRSDLLAQLIASYTPNSRGGYVNGIKIMVSRTELGRALKLPTEKIEVTEDVMGAIDWEESIAFFEKFMSTWMLLHEGDACFMSPPEVLDCTKLIKEGHLEEIDWAGLMWSMVEKELKASDLGKCYYASHLQHLIKTQHEKLLREEFEVDIEVWDDEVLGEHDIELVLGQNNGETYAEEELVGDEQVMDFEEFKEEEAAGQWPLLQQCNAVDLTSLEEEEEEEEHEGGFHISPKCIPLVGLSSGSLIQAMEVEHQMPISSGMIELEGNSVADLFSSRENTRMVSGMSHFGNGHKRDIGLQDNHNLQYQSLNGSNKRLRSDGLLMDDANSVDFNMCMEHIQHWMGKARMMYATKEQTCEESSMNEQELLNELQKRNNIIEYLHHAKLEESQKTQMDVYKLQKELYMMTKLLEGYRKALKESQKAFQEYRASCPQANESLYKDVPGSGGLVQSVMEEEKESLKQEE